MYFVSFFMRTNFPQHSKFQLPCYNYKRFLFPFSGKLNTHTLVFPNNFDSKCIFVAFFLKMRNIVVLLKNNIPINPRYNINWIKLENYYKSINTSHIVCGRLQYNSDFQRIAVAQIMKKAAPSEDRTQYSIVIVLKRETC